MTGEIYSPNKFLDADQFPQPCSFQQLQIFASQLSESRRIIAQLCLHLRTWILAINVRALALQARR